MRPSTGLIENCTLDPPVSTPISRRTAIDALRMIWYSLSVSVCAGATVIESPVWTPIGSKFSIEQTMMQLSLRSRTTSISNSFQPKRDSSIKSSRVGDKSRPRLQISSNSSRLYAIPPPDPPMVKEGRITTGKPSLPVSPWMRCWTSSASSNECAIPDLADPRPILVIASLNFWRSSALSIASGDAPISSQPYFSSTPWRCRSKAQFKAVWPPMVGKIASGFSVAIIRSTTSQVIGSM